MTTFILMAGLPATGKTTLAQALASKIGGVVLSKDTVRAALFPGEWTDYTVEQDDLCMQAALQAAQYLAHNKRADFIFLDGRTFSRAYQVEQAIRAAEDCGARWKIIHLTVPDEVAKRRLEGVQAGEHVAKNRDFTMYQELQKQFQPITLAKLDVDAAEIGPQLVQKCLAYIVE